MKHLLVLISVAALGACSTSLTVKHLAGVPATAEGPVYHLPKVRYDLVATYTLKSCDDTADAELAVKATTVFIQDPARWYEVTYSSLASGMKTTDLQLSLWPNGTLKTINATAEDKTSEVAVAVGKGLVQLSLPNIKMMVEEEGKKESECDAALRALKEANAEIKNLEEGFKDPKTGKTHQGLIEIRAELARLLQKGSATRDEEQRIRALTETISRLEALEKPQKKKQAQALDTLTETVTASFEPDWATRAKFVEPGLKARRWGLSHLLCVQVDDGSGQGCDGQPEIKAPEGVPQPPGEGAVYRQPVPARLLVCRGSNTSCLGQDDNLVTTETSVPQLGVLARLSLKNDAFESNSIGAEFGADGGLVKFGFKNTGGGAAAAGTFDSLAGQYASYRKDPEAKNETARERNSAVGQNEQATAVLESEIARVEAEIKLQKLQQQLDELKQQ